VTVQLSSGAEVSVVAAYALEKAEAASAQPIVSFFIGISLKTN